MKQLWLFGAVLLAAFVPIPISAQIQTTPSPSNNAVIDHAIDYAQSVGILGVIVALLGVAFIVLIILLILFAWRVAIPFLNAWQTDRSADRTAREAAVIAERQARTDAQTTSSTQLSISNEREREMQTLRTRQAEALERLGDKMIENDKNQEQRYTALETSINTNTNEQVKTTKDEIMKELKSIRDSLSDEKPGLGFRIAHVETLLASILEAKAPQVPLPSTNGAVPLQPSSETSA